MVHVAPSLENESGGQSWRGLRASKPMTDTLGDALPREMTRVRDAVLPVYQEIGPAGGFAVAMMRRSLDFATRALAEGDVTAMLIAFEELKGWEL